MCFGLGFYSNPLQLLMSPCSPIQNSTTSPVLLLLYLSTFDLFTFMSAECPLHTGRSESLNSPCFPWTAVCKTLFFQWHILLILSVLGVGDGCVLSSPVRGVWGGGGSREAPMEQEKQLRAGAGAVCWSHSIHEWPWAKVWEHLVVSTTLWSSGHFAKYHETSVALWVKWEHPHFYCGIWVTQPYMRQMEDSPPCFAFHLVVILGYS